MLPSSDLLQLIFYLLLNNRIIPFSTQVFVGVTGVNYPNTLRKTTLRINVLNLIVFINFLSHLKNLNSKFQTTMIKIWIESFENEKNTNVIIMLKKRATKWKTKIIKECQDVLYIVYRNIEQTTSERNKKQTQK